jgi:hypothetical protein
MMLNTVHTIAVHMTTLAGAAAAAGDSRCEIVANGPWTGGTSALARRCAR